MYCPNCAEPRAQENIQFCTKCGHDVTGGRGSAKGMRQGFVLIVLGLLLIPVWMFIGAAFPPNDRLVESAPSTTWGESIAWILMWIAFLAAAARIAYALMFEGAGATGNSERNTPQTLGAKQSNAALPSADSFEGIKPGQWKTTGDLREPAFPKLRTSGDLH